MNLASILLHFQKMQSQTETFELQLLGVNDLHGQLDTYNASLNAGGIEYLASYLKQREADNPNTLMVQAGDAVGASSSCICTITR